MEASVKSGGMVKKKSASGCLIIKTKGTSTNDSRRPKKAARGSSSSDEDESLELMRKKFNEKRMNNGIQLGNVGMDGNGERKSRLDLFEFDEYDEFDVPNVGNKFLGDSFKKTGQIGVGRMKESVVGSSNRNLVVHKRKESPCFSDSSGQRSKELRYTTVEKEGLYVEDDDIDMPISLLKLKYQGISDDPIRLQGKNGVLKVMMKKKNMTLENSDAGDVTKKISSKFYGHGASDHLVSKRPENRLLIYQSKKSAKNRKSMELVKEKPSVSKETKTSESESEGMDTKPKLTSPGVQTSCSKKKMKHYGERYPLFQTPANISEGKEGKSKRGGSTEKKMLRDKIRGMLVDAGWSIDYRPRRNRDYLDAVYINPSGTAYWSIIKAYDALKKQSKEERIQIREDASTSAFAPLSDDLINKLTRKTRKKIEEAKRRKKKKDSISQSDKQCSTSDSSSDSDQDEEQLSSYVNNNSQEMPLNASRSESILERTTNVIGRCTLLVRGSNTGGSLDSEGYISYHGKRTVLAWVIDSGTAKLSEKVQYMNRKKTRVMLEGWITRDGIHCGCCSKILTVSKFELHAGSKLRQPFQNIFLESGASLLQCQLDAWNNQDDSLRQDFQIVDVENDDLDDDTCCICGDGGDLICCDSCPSTFHQACLGIQMLPLGDWHCPNCTCKFCGYFGIDNDAEGEDTAAAELKNCISCEKKYHETCSEKVHARYSSRCASFCGQKCQELHENVQKILGIKQELEAGFSWSLIQRKDLSDSSHRSFPLRVECNSKLAVALSVMDECFLPIVDRRSGINLIQNAVYNCGSNFNRLNYHGFYTVILERGDEIISAASIRLHGDRIAEMPFIGTRPIYRRQGMCRRLLSAIESLLGSLKVQKLIIPAIPEHMNTWTNVFGFRELEDADKKEIKSLNMLVFPGTDMLQKQLLKRDVSVNVSLGVNEVKPEMENTETGSRLSSEKSKYISGMENKLPESSVDSAIDAATAKNTDDQPSPTSWSETVINGEPWEQLNPSEAGETPVSETRVHSSDIVGTNAASRDTSKACDGDDALVELESDNKPGGDTGISDAMSAGGD